MASSRSARWLLAALLALGACAGQVAGGEDPGGGGGGEDAGAGGGDGEDPGDGGGLADRECPEDSFLTYQNLGGPFLSEYCSGCHSAEIPADMRHGAPPGVDFETLDKARDRAEGIYRRAADDNATMPPAGGPSADERVLLGEWLACGAPG